MALDINDYEPAFRYGAKIQTDDYADASVTGAKLITGKGYFTVAVPTNGTTPVNLFGTTNGFAGTITSVTAIAQDTTAGSISLVTNVSGSETTVANRIIKSTSIGGVAGTVVAATAFSSAGTTTVVSNSAGNAIVVATFTVA